MEDIEYKGEKDGKNIYSVTFSLGEFKLGERTEDKYCGINTYDSIIQMLREQFTLRLIKKAYNYDLDKPEDFHEFMKKVNPDYDTTLEDLKKDWDYMDEL